MVTSWRCPLKIARCVQVIVTPEERSITVFNNGKPHGSSGSIPTGGQTQPILIAGLKLQ